MPLFGAPNIEKLRETRDIAALIKALAHKDAQIRRDAASALGELGDHRAVKPLAAALKDDEIDVRRSAATAFIKVSDKADVEAVPILRDIAATYAEMSIVRAAFEALLRLGMQCERPEPFIECLKSDDPAVCASAIAQLGRLRAVSAVGPLLGLLVTDRSYTLVGRELGSDLQITERRVWKDPEARAAEEGNRQRAVQVLGEILGPEAGAEAIWEFFQQGGHDENALWAALEELGWESLHDFGRTASSALQTSLAQASTPSEKVQAINLLSRRRDPSLIAIFAKAFSDDDVHVSQAGADALAAIGEEAEDTLIPYLRSERWDVKKRAVVALKEIGGARVERALGEMRETEQDSEILRLLST